MVALEQHRMGDRSAIRFVGSLKYAVRIEPGRCPGRGGAFIDYICDLRTPNRRQLQIVGHRQGMMRAGVHWETVSTGGTEIPASAFNVIASATALVDSIT